MGDFAKNFTFVMQTTHASILDIAATMDSSHSTVISMSSA